MIETRWTDSDGEFCSSSAIDSLGQLSRSSMSSSSFSRVSFDCLPAPPLHLDATAVSLKPHRSSSDSAYSAMQHGSTRLGLRDFRLHRRIGAGDIGTVFLCSLDRKSSSRALGVGSEEDGADDEGTGTAAAKYYAMKVVDKEAVEKKQKGERVEMERRILNMVDHPFLPTLYAEFEASQFSCIVMEFCSGGDLHSLRHKQPLNRFSLSSARFYAAEVLVALEYLHMLGIIYRDLKPENVLVRSDGHIMLSDFDLSFFSDAVPAVESPPSASPAPSPSSSKPLHRGHFSCIPFGRLFRSRKVRNLTPNRLFVAEPVAARSCSFVGTHEYLAPEVASGGSHGNAVDWWSFGIFIYEMIYGQTPFVGASNKATLRNIVEKSLWFPGDAPASTSEMHARDLISGLLCKDPAKRLGSKRGSAEVKNHPFFKGLNFALIRSLTPPEMPGSRRQQQAAMPVCRTQLTAFDYF
ncbi:hypothetical protein SAY87_031457 [Trapa incisa]|uniref:non-specific serine/threonine protein kinase n=1 Tax=Trapa incisa TaxID=236973 RepID=A0AAN7KQ78_9MYRT|nr:hypothetical protein SAY87_031457 [Trapa incisa]